MTPINDILLTSAEDADFLCQQGPLVCAERQTVSSAEHRTGAFLLEVVMPKGVYKRKPWQGFRKGNSIGHRFLNGHKHSEVIKKKIGNSQRGEKGNNWKGGKTITGVGYILICSYEHPYRNGKGYVREHRLIVEKQIGRYLTPKEVVHHLGDKQDNRPEKLMAFIDDATHQRFENNSIIKPEEIIFDGRKLKGGKDNDGKETNS